jgi:hypothetical protein
MFLISEMQDAIVIEAGAVSSSDFEANLFDPSPTDSRYLITAFTEHFPKNSLTGNSSSIQFEMPELTANNAYMFHNTFLFLKAKLTKEDGTKATDHKLVAPINLVLYTMFNHVDVLLNNVAVSSHKHNYPYKVYLQTLLSYSNTTKSAELQAAGYYADQHGHFEVFNMTSAG